MKLGLDATIPLASEPGIEFERRAKREPIRRNRTIRADEKRKRPQKPRADSRQRPPLANGFTSASEMTGPERSQSSMSCLLMVERGAASTSAVRSPRLAAS
jgi:hypothetical protein